MQISIIEALADTADFLASSRLDNRNGRCRSPGVLSEKMRLDQITPKVGERWEDAKPGQKKNGIENRDKNHDGQEVAGIIFQQIGNFRNAKGGGKIIGFGKLHETEIGGDDETDGHADGREHDAQNHFVVGEIGGGGEADDDDRAQTADDEKINEHNDGAHQSVCKKFAPIAVPFRQNFFFAADDVAEHGEVIADCKKADEKEKARENRNEDAKTANRRFFQPVFVLKSKR